MNDESLAIVRQPLRIESPGARSFECTSEVRAAAPSPEDPPDRPPEIVPEPPLEGPPASPGPDRRDELPSRAPRESRADPGAT